MQTVPQDTTPTPAPDADVLDLTGRNATLLAQRRGELTAFVFVRHSGCVFCREQLTDLREHAGEIADAGLAVVIVTPDRPPTALKLARDLDLPFPVMCDPRRRSYAAYGLTEGTLGQLLSPHILKRGFENARRGNLPRRPTSNARQMPGTAFVDRHGRLLHLHVARDSADHQLARDLVSWAGTLAATRAASGSSARA